MNWFNNLKIAIKLSLGFGACLVLAAVIGVTAIDRMATMSRAMDSALRQSVGELNDLARIIAATRHVRTLEFQYVIDNSPKERAGFSRDMAQELAIVKPLADDYGKSITDPIDKANYDTLSNDWLDYLSEHNIEMQLARSHQDLQAESELNGPMRVKFHAYGDLLNKMVDWNTRHGEWYDREVNRIYHSAAILVVTVLMLTLALASLIGVFISKRVRTSLVEVSHRLETLEAVDIASLRRAVEALESGDLTVAVKSDTELLTSLSHDEIGEMGVTFNKMLAQIRSTLESFRKSQSTLGAMVSGLQESASHVSSASEMLAASSEQISAGARQISATMREVASATEQSARGATDVAHGAADQAAALGEGAELVRQLVIAVNSVARDAESTAHSAHQANEVATHGAVAVSQAIEGMERIRATVSQSTNVVEGLGEASTQIGAIVGAIEEIAEQTNLLALNAAIEAARAGDAGRGFAVVADEVRKLAERSRLATQEIGQLISRVQSHTKEAVEAMQVGSVEVGKGCELAAGAGDALARIKREMSSVSDQVQNICSAAEQMLASSEEVSRSIGDVAAGVQESSSAAEQMSASAEEVSASIQTVASTVAEQTSAVQHLVAASTQLSTIASVLKESSDGFVTDSRTSANQAPSIRKAA